MGFTMMCVMQAPYAITVTSPMYNSVLNVYNAALGDSTNGTASFQVTSSDLDLLADFSNMVNVTYFIDAKSQVHSLLSCIRVSCHLERGACIQIQGSDPLGNALTTCYGIQDAPACCVSMHASCATMKWWKVH